jgi:hypothetical protein
VPAGTQLRTIWVSEEGLTGPGVSVKGCVAEVEVPSLVCGGFAWLMAAAAE